MDNVHVGVQVRRDPWALVPADRTRASWTVDVDVVRTDGALDFRGPAVQGRRGERFVYLTWGNVDADGGFEMFRRAKLMLDRIEPALVDSRAGPGWAPGACRPHRRRGRPAVRAGRSTGDRVVGRRDRLNTLRRRRAPRLRRSPTPR